MSRHSAHRRRKILLAAVALFLGLNSIWAVKAVNSDGAVLPRAPYYGISDPDLYNETAAQQALDLAGMAAIGITSVRVDANWIGVQPSGPTTYNWTLLDQEVKSILAVGMSADLIIDGCAPWAALRGYSGHQFAQPASAAQFATYAASVAARYGPEGVGYYEIWNEPNIARFWVPKPNPVAYTADLVAAYAAIKNVDPSAFVISAGLSPAGNDGTHYSPITFLQDMYAHGAKGNFDALGFHPYTYPLAPDTYSGGSAWSQMDETSPSIRSIMTQHGDAAKQIFITEYGAPSIGPSAVGPIGQSTDISQALAYVKNKSWVGAFYIYTWRDLAVLGAADEGYGLEDVNGLPKPAFLTVLIDLLPAG